MNTTLNPPAVHILRQPVPALVGWRAHFTQAARQALQWRLLLLWLLALGLPTLLGILPLWVTLAGVLDHAPLATRLVEGFSLPLLVDTLGVMRTRGYSPASALGAGLVFVLLLPWISGVALTAARSRTPLRIGALLAGGLADYARMARLWLWALVPLGIAAGIGGGAMHLAKEHAQGMTLEADADHLIQAALALGGLLFLLAHASLDAARAQLVAEPQRRSVVLAWWRAVKGLWRQPGRIALYLLITAAGLLLAAALGVLRLQVAPVGGLSFVAALLAGQAVVAALGWMRCARLFAMVNTAQR